MIKRGLELPSGSIDTSGFTVAMSQNTPIVVEPKRAGNYCLGGETGIKLYLVERPCGLHRSAAQIRRWGAV